MNGLTTDRDVSISYPVAVDLVRMHAAALEVAESTARSRLQHRDGLLAALERPRWHAHYRGADLLTQAGVLAEGLVGSHAWVDGNKRTTWLAIRAFLAANEFSWQRRPEVASVVEQTTRLTTRAINSDEVAAWLRRHIRASDTPGDAAVWPNTTSSGRHRIRSTEQRRVFANLAKQFAREDRAILEALAAFDRGEYP